jgi:hypothetical protein
VILLTTIDSKCVSSAVDWFQQCNAVSFRMPNWWTSLTTVPNCSWKCSAGSRTCTSMDDETSWPSYAVLPWSSQKVPHIQVRFCTLHNSKKHLLMSVKPLLESKKRQSQHSCLTARALCIVAIRYCQTRYFSRRCCAVHYFAYVYTVCAVACTQCAWFKLYCPPRCTLFVSWQLQ